ncbi:MAG: mRNA surveillance protein pelota [Candidatus Thermoplasmatota archaeon]
MARVAMRVLHRDPRSGEIKLRIENPDDLWHLHNLVVPGDHVRASTYRREESKTDKVRPERAEKVRVTLTLQVDKLEFQAFSDRLRITGVIVEGPQDLGRHHTLNVGVDDVLSVIKTWKAHELRRIDEAVAASQKPLVTFLSLDDEEALLAQLRQYGVQELATIRAPGHGKMFATGDAQSAYFDDILSKLRTLQLGEALILVGPGFAREDFLERLKARNLPLAEKVHTQGTSQPGMHGIQEALRSGMGVKLFGESRVAHETALVEKLLEAIATNRPSAYGRAEVAEAVEAGAVETLLVSDAVVRDLEIERLMHDVESARGKVVLVSRHHEAGAKLEGLGGIGALLRYPIK